MAYIFYSVSFLLLVLATALYITRTRWLPMLPLPEYIYTRLPSSFAADIESGLSSSAFDLSANLAEGDSRAGLDEQGKKAVRKIMRSRRVGFDEARRIYTEQRFAKNNVGPDGLPRDPKFVSFS
ncbi:MAG: hypothetical protein M1813_006702 [Trichoglossum hirsutum]|nr:MAG: hypothetical protein M1813_006702 [Trichoglossum hirsutum]